MSHHNKSSLYHPKYWLSWLVIATFRAVNTLPFKIQIIIGQKLGRLIRRFSTRRRHIVETNIKLCFPELNINEQQKLINDTFTQNSIGLFEISSAWWAKQKDLNERYEINGLEYINKFKKDGFGILLIGAHYTHLDLCGIMISQNIPLDIVYRKNNDPVFERIITSGRKKFFDEVLDRSKLRTIVQRLRDGRIVWYTPDQDFGGKHSIFAPFFGVNASTITTPARLLAMGNAKPISVHFCRDPHTHKYLINFKPIDRSYPTGDDYQDACILNRSIEEDIRQQPDQYMWVHRRFKTRPNGEQSLY